MYTDEKNVLILISLLKANGINKVVASPGTTNMTFVSSLQNDGCFDLISCVDERSAAYMACGLASDGNPVVITCTGATASRNYMPGLTEAFYRKLPILAVCGHRGISKIGHLIDQQIDRRAEPDDIAVEKIWLPIIKDAEDEQYCINEANKAIIALSKHGGGPVIVNLCTKYSQSMDVLELPIVPVMRFHTSFDDMPEISYRKVAIFAGEHSEYSKSVTSEIDNFCASYNAVVFCDHSSGYYGKYAVHASLFLGQPVHLSLSEIDLLITIGEVSGDSYSLCLLPQYEWRVSEDGLIRNRFGKLCRVFEMPIDQFFRYYSNDRHSQSNTFLMECQREYHRVFSQIPELPFGNIWIAQKLSAILPSPSFLQLGILNSLRSWNFFYLPSGVKTFSNVGGFGIDGTLSTLIGRSLLYPSNLHFCVIGDLSFFYDINSLGNRHIGGNLRILLINNGLGAEFCNYGHPAYHLGDAARANIAAEGHFGKKSKCLVKQYVESLGFKYLSAENKDEFYNMVPDFLNTTISTSIVFEVFVNSKDEDISLKEMLNIILPEECVEDVSLQRKFKQKVSSIIGKQRVQVVKAILGKS